MEREMPESRQSLEPMLEDPRFRKFLEIREAHLKRVPPLTADDASFLFVTALADLIMCHWMRPWYAIQESDIACCLLSAAIVAGPSPPPAHVFDPTEEGRTTWRRYLEAVQAGTGPGYMRWREEWFGSVLVERRVHGPRARAIEQACEEYSVHIMGHPNLAELRKAAKRAGRRTPCDEVLSLAAQEAGTDSDDEILCHILDVLWDCEGAHVVGRDRRIHPNYGKAFDAFAQRLRKRKRHRDKGLALISLDQKDDGAGNTGSALIDLLADGSVEAVRQSQEHRIFHQIVDFARDVLAGRDDLTASEAAVNEHLWELTRGDISDEVLAGRVGVNVRTMRSARKSLLAEVAILLGRTRGE